MDITHFFMLHKSRHGLHDFCGARNPHTPGCTPHIFRAPQKSAWTARPLWSATRTRQDVHHIISCSTKVGVGRPDFCGARNTHTAGCTSHGFRAPQKSALLTRLLWGSTRPHCAYRITSNIFSCPAILSFDDHTFVERETHIRQDVQHTCFVLRKSWRGRPVFCGASLKRTHGRKHVVHLVCSTVQLIKDSFDVQSAPFRRVCGARPGWCLSGQRH